MGESEFDLGENEFDLGENKLDLGENELNLGENVFDLCENEFDLGEYEPVGGVHGLFKSAISSFNLLLYDWTNQYRPRTTINKYWMRFL